MPRHDVVVLGTGAAGLVAALAAHDAGAAVGLYEKADVGALLQACLDRGIEPLTGREQRTLPSTTDG